VEQILFFPRSLFLLRGFLVSRFNLRISAKSVDIFVSRSSFFPAFLIHRLCISFVVSWFPDSVWLDYPRHPRNPRLILLQ
jgi:hypothetical protein